MKMLLEVGTVISAEVPVVFGSFENLELSRLNDSDAILSWIVSTQW